MAWFFMAGREGIYRPMGPFQTPQRATAQREYMRSIGYDVGAMASDEPDA